MMTLSHAAAMAVPLRTLVALAEEKKFWKVNYLFGGSCFQVAEAGRLAFLQIQVVKIGK